MVQAPVRALDPDGIAVVTTGTIGFALGAVVCWLAMPQLAPAGKGWYLGVAITGTVIGLLGLSFSFFRKLRRREEDTPEAAADAGSSPD
jgi:hypothetical protein